MKIEEILAHRLICIQEKVYMCFVQYDFMSFKDFVQEIVETEKPKTLYLFCSPMMKSIIQSFSLSHLHSLATGIEIFQDSAIETLENDGKIRILVCSDQEGKQPIGFCEQVTTTTSSS